MRKAASRSAKPKAAPAAAPLSFDIAGIIILAMGAVSLVSLASPREAGEIGRDIEQLLRLMAGAGAWVVPVLAFVVAAMLMYGALRVQASRRAVAAVALWLLVISWLHVLRAPWPASPDTHFSHEAMRQGGGYIGAGISYFLLVALGRTSSLVVIAALGLVSVLVLLDVPLFSSLAQMLKDRQQAGRAQPKPAREVKTPEQAPQPTPARQQTKPDRESVVAKAIEARSKASETELAQTLEGREILTTQPVVRTGKSAAAVTPLLAGDDDPDYELPPVSLLQDSPPMPPRSADELSENVEIIERTLLDFKIDANVIEIAHGPTVTRYEIQLAPGIRVNKIVSLADNIAMSLAAINVRVEAPIPGKSAIGVEVPNRHRGLVSLKDVLLAPALAEHPSKLAFPLGLDVSGNPIVADLCAMPHLLVAGATNMGKSVMLNTLISSFLFRATPKEVKFILIDPKRVELSLFEGIPHLASPVIRQVKAAAGILRAAVQEMDRRYDKLANKGTRNIQGYNELVAPPERMPYLVIVVDELADLMMQAQGDVEGSICRIAQLARAVGIHLVIATQRPSVDVVTGTIKANIASRIAFAVSSQVDSRTVLDQNGAERLIGKGDMLFRPIDAPKPMRIQGAFLSEQEVKGLVEHLKAQGAPESMLQPVDAGVFGGDGEGGDDPALADEYYEPAVRLVISSGRASTSMIQRRFRIGYTRAARLVDAMETQGLVGPPDGANPREVLVNADQMDQIFGLPQGTTAAERSLEEDEPVAYEDEPPFDDSDDEEE